MRLIILIGLLMITACDTDTTEFGSANPYCDDPNACPYKKGL